MPSLAGGVALLQGIKSLGGSKGLGMAKRNQEWVQENLTLGNKLDLENQKAMFNYRIQSGIRDGMTPFEMYMGPAAGAGGGTTGSGQTLGNSASQLGQQMMQQKNQNRIVNAQIGADLLKTKMQTDAQRDVAETQFKGTQYSADTQKAIAVGRLGFDKEVYYKTTAPEAAARMGLTTQQTLKAANEVVTSDKEFVKLMKVASMSSENILATLVAIGLPFDVLEPNEAKKLTKEEREKATAAILSLLSTSRKELTGLEAYFRGLVEGYKTEEKIPEDWFQSDEKLGNQKMGSSNMDALPGWVNQ